jgi:hypothetical protein
MAVVKPIVEGVVKGAGMLGDSFDDLLRYVDGDFDKRFYRAPNNQKQSPVYRPDTELVVPNDKFSRLAFQDLEGYPYMSTMADRLAANRRLTGIGGKDLDIPINLTGGQGFMGFNEDLWVSGVKPIQDMQKAAREIKDLYGIDPLLMPFRMAPSGGDFAHATGQAMLSFASKYMNKSAKKDLDKKMKSVMPDWVGIDNPDMINQFSNLPDTQRKNLMKFMDTNYRDDGGISLGQARLAVSDQDQLKGIDMGFQNVGQLDLEKGINPTGGNLVYPSSFAGKSLGVVDQTENIPTLLDLNPRKFNRAVFEQDQNVTKQYKQGGKKGEFKSGPQDGFAYLSDMTDKAASARSNIYGGLIDEPMLRNLQEQGFKIDANGYVTAAAGAGGLVSMMGSEDADAGVGGVLKNVMPAPQRMFDPSNKDYKPFLSDFEQQAGGRYLEMGPDGPVDITGTYPASANISISPDGKPKFQVAGEERTGTPPNDGRKIKTNLFKKKAGWKWSEVPEGFDPNPAGNFPLVSVEDGKNHYYTVDAQFPDGVDLARYPNSASEPRLRPTRKGKVELGSKIGEIDVRGKKHPVYDKAVIREGAAGATAIGALSSQDADADIPLTIDQLRNQTYQGINANSLNQGLFSGIYDSDVGSIEAATNPLLQSIAYGLGRVDTPIGKPFESASNVLNRWAYGEGADNMDLFGMGLESLDFIPAVAPITRSVGKTAKGLMGAF